MKFYHVDRHKKLQTGQKLEYFQYDDLVPEEFRDTTTKETTKKAFPEGISMHGDGYFLADESSSFIQAVPNEQFIGKSNNAIDLVFELVRKAYYPDKPSRWQSLFAVKTLKQAQGFIKQVNWDISSPIWEVESEDYLRVNMNLLNITGRNVDIYSRAFAYWSGEKFSDPNPRWEYLLRYPVSVIKRVS